MELRTIRVQHMSLMLRQSQRSDPFHYVASKRVRYLLSGYDPTAYLYT